eukprot:3931388-Pleurochrysis_carterae.AAC.1
MRVRPSRCSRAWQSEHSLSRIINAHAVDFTQQAFSPRIRDRQSPNVGTHARHSLRDAIRMLARP